MYQKISFRILLVFAFVSTLLIGVTSAGTLSAQISVDVGGKMMVANGTSPLTAFVPQTVEIKAGETVTWINPTPVSEPHTVTFLKDQKFFAPPVAPFTIPSSTEFTPVAQGANVEPNIIPPSNESATTETVIIDNGRSTNPVVIDSTGKNVTYLNPNSTYAFQGNEQYLNSGWMWPEGQVPPGAPYLATFSVKFEKPGTYSYLCTVHPWMTGSVTVK